MAESVTAPQKDGKIADNIVYFARTLRGAGMRVGPAMALDAVDAVRTAGIGSRDDLYWVLHSIFVNRREDRPVFEEAFNLFWRSRDLIEKMIAMFSPMANPTAEKEKSKAGSSRVSEALFKGKQREEKHERPEVEVDATFSMSGKEVLKSKDFAQMSVAELEAAKQAMSELRLPLNLVPTRRFRPSPHGDRIDARAMMRQSMKTGGDLVLPRFREPREIHPPLVVLADISGSMSQYSRIFLHFLHAISEKRRRVHTFLFGTRLTNVTRALARKDPDEAFQEVSDLVEDWEGGTRIADTLNSFNRLWSRRVLGQGAIVLLITDGLDRPTEESPHDLDKEMERLHKSCRRLIWLNPLLRFEGFQARASGVRTMLPHVDEFRAVHSMNSLTELCAALSGSGNVIEAPARWLKGA
ncbi:MAG: VWA domain-containing protein [Pseudomonadota bacterium]